ncbi:hypothetical protein PTKU46_94020 [Paraburkholderia terrae]
MIRVQRERMKAQLRGTPSLQPILADDEWIKDVWADARQEASTRRISGLRFFLSAARGRWNRSSIRCSGRTRAGGTGTPCEFKAFPAGPRRTCTARRAADCELRIVSSTDAMRLYDQDPEFATRAD